MGSLVRVVGAPSLAVMLAGCAPPDDPPSGTSWFVDMHLEGPTRVSSDGAEFRLTVTNDMDVPACLTLVADDPHLPIILVDVATGEPAGPFDEHRGPGLLDLPLTKVTVEPGTSRTFAGLSWATPDYVVRREREGRPGYDLLPIGSGIELYAEASWFSFPCRFAHSEEARIAGEVHLVPSNRSRLFTF